MNIIDDIPGEADYNDFWEVQKVTVPMDYVANTVTSYAQIMDSAYTIEETTTLVNCPVVFLNWIPDLNCKPHETT